MLIDYVFATEKVPECVKDRYGIDKTHFLSALKQILVGDVLYIDYIELSTGKRYIAEAGKYFDGSLDLVKVDALNEYMKSDEYILIRVTPTSDQIERSCTYPNGDTDRTVIYFDMYVVNGECFVGKAFVQKSKNVVYREFMIDELTAILIKTTTMNTKKGTLIAIRNEDHFIHIGEDLKSKLFVDFRRYDTTVDEKDMDETVNFTTVQTYPADVIFQEESGKAYRARIVFFYDSHSSNIVYITNPVQLEPLADVIDVSKDAFEFLIMSDDYRVLKAANEWQIVTLTENLQIKNFLYNIYRKVRFSYVQYGSTFTAPVTFKYRRKPCTDDTVEISLVP